MSKLLVLILHQMGNPKKWRESVKSLELMIPENRNDLNYIIHDTSVPFPKFLKELDYNLIVLNSTFLDNRYNNNSLCKIKNEYSFIKFSNACKIALPQDDYDCSEILDDWMVEWSIDKVYTVCPEYWDILYPKFSLKNNITLGYTSYVTKKWIENWKNPLPFDKREIDVSYRAFKLPPNFGSLGQLKWKIADRFINAIKQTGEKINLDISVRDQDMIPGSKWHDFLENSKFCLATPSGSSLLDPRNQVRKKTRKFIAKFPNATFEEIENICFPNLDNERIFSAISPRNIEAILAETIQIATPGKYSGILFKNEHFIHLEEDCSNIIEIIELMKDSQFLKSIAENAKSAILSEERLRADFIVNEIIQYAESVVSKRVFRPYSQEFIQKKIAKYHDEISKIQEITWRKHDNFNRIKDIAKITGALRIYHFLGLGV